jgi:hypothetical protein
MPKIYRVMRKAADNKPVIDATGKGLGVRGTPVNGVADVDLDTDGNVLLNNKGMSVVPTWRDLPYFLVPKRLSDKVLGARGAVNTFCFTMGEGPFGDAPVAPGLDLKVDRPTHGNVVPHALVPLEQFQADLARTRDGWTIDEA